MGRNEKKERDIYEGNELYKEVRKRMKRKGKGIENRRKKGNEYEGVRSG